MKKHKSVVAILLAVMMIFTFMPTMAFADAPDATKAKAVFNSDYSEVTIPAYVDDSDGIQVPEKTYKTIRTYNPGTGVITAEPDPKGADDYSWSMPTGISASYYDLSTAELAEANGTTLKAEYAYGTFDPAKITSIKLNAPSYVEKDASGKLPAAKTVTFGDFKAATKWDGKVVGTETFKPEIRTAQEFTVSFGGEYTGSLTATDTPFIGSIAAKNVKVNAATPDPSEDAKYFFDAEDDSAVKGTTAVQDYSTMYDGATHTFMASTVSGWTSAMSVLDLSTGKWTPSTAVTLSDVQKKATQVKVEWTKAGDQKPSVTHMFNLNLTKAGYAKVGFALTKEGNKIYSVDGSTYDASSYVVATANKEYSKGGDASLKVKDAATAKAVEANKAELIAYFNEKYTVVETTPKFNQNVVELTIESKDLSKTELDKIDKKYEALLDRFQGVIVFADEDTDEATVALNGIDLTDYEIEFTNAPSKKVIKTKKAKTTKTVKFNVKAECKNGTVVKYKLINAPKKSITIDANTGKITVKKGLAKGTYTFKVKAYIPGSYNYYSDQAVSEIQTIKVVVKKTKK